MSETTTCGSDLHFTYGFIPTMRAGDVIGALREMTGGRGPDGCVRAVFTP